MRIQCPVKIEEIYVYIYIYILKPFLVDFSVFFRGDLQKFGQSSSDVSLNASGTSGPS